MLRSPCSLHSELSFLIVFAFIFCLQLAQKLSLGVKMPQIPGEHKVSGGAGSGSYICIIKPFHSTKLVQYLCI